MKDFWRGEIFDGYRNISPLREPRRTTPTPKLYRVLSFPLIFSQELCCRLSNPEMAIQTVSKPAGKGMVSLSLSASDHLLTIFEESEEEQMNLLVPFTALCINRFQG